MENDDLYLDVFRAPTVSGLRAGKLLEPSPKKKKTKDVKVHPWQSIIEDKMVSETSMIDESSIDIYSDLSRDTIIQDQEQSSPQKSTLSSAEVCLSDNSFKPPQGTDCPMGNGDESSMKLDLFTEILTMELTDKNKVQSRLKELEAVNKKLLQEIQDLKQCKEQLSKNISSLYLTAKKEISKKEEEIERLRKSIGEKEQFLTSPKSAKTEQDLRQGSGSDSSERRNSSRTSSDLQQKDWDRNRGRSQRHQNEKTDSVRENKYTIDSKSSKVSYCIDRRPSHLSPKCDDRSPPPRPSRDQLWKSVNTRGDEDFVGQSQKRSHSMCTASPIRHDNRHESDQVAISGSGQNDSVSFDLRNRLKRRHEDGQGKLRTDTKEIQPTERVAENEHQSNSKLTRQTVTTPTTTPSKDVQVANRQSQCQSSPFTKRPAINQSVKKHSSEVRDRLKQEISQSYSLASCQGVASRGKAKSSPGNNQHWLVRGNTSTSKVQQKSPKDERKCQDMSPAKEVKTSLDNNYRNVSLHQDRPCTSVAQACEARQPTTTGHSSVPDTKFVSNVCLEAGAMELSQLETERTKRHFEAAGQGTDITSLGTDSSDVSLPHQGKPCISDTHACEMQQQATVAHSSGPVTKAMSNACLGTDALKSSQLKTNRLQKNFETADRGTDIIKKTPLGDRKSSTHNNKKRTGFEHSVIDNLPCCPLNEMCRQLVNLSKKQSPAHIPNSADENLLSLSKNMNANTEKYPTQAVQASPERKITNLCAETNQDSRHIAPIFPSNSRGEDTSQSNPISIQTRTLALQGPKGSHNSQDSLCMATHSGDVMNDPHIPMLKAKISVFPFPHDQSSPLTRSPSISTSFVDIEGVTESEELPDDDDDDENSHHSNNSVFDQEELSKGTVSSHCSTPAKLAGQHWHKTADKVQNLENDASESSSSKSGKSVEHESNNSDRNSNCSNIHSSPDRGHNRQLESRLDGLFETSNMDTVANVTHITCTSNLILLGEEEEENSCTTFASPSKCQPLPSEFYPPGVRAHVREEGSHARHIRGQSELIPKSAVQSPSSFQYEGSKSTGVFSNSVVKKTAEVLDPNTVTRQSSGAESSKSDQTTNTGSLADTLDHSETVFSKSSVTATHMKPQGQKCGGEFTQGLEMSGSNEITQNEVVKEKPQCDVAASDHLTDGRLGIDIKSSLNNAILTEDWASVVKKTFENVFKIELDTFKLEASIRAKSSIFFNQSCNSAAMEKIKSLNRQNIPNQIDKHYTHSFPKRKSHFLLNSHAETLMGLDASQNNTSSFPVWEGKQLAIDQDPMYMERSELQQMACSTPKHAKGCEKLMGQWRISPDCCVVTSSDIHSEDVSVRGNNSLNASQACRSHNALHSHEPDSTSDAHTKGNTCDKSSSLKHERQKIHRLQQHTYAGREPSRSSLSACGPEMKDQSKPRSSELGEKSSKSSDLTSKYTKVKCSQPMDICLNDQLYLSDEDSKENEGNAVEKVHECHSHSPGSSEKYGAQSKSLNATPAFLNEASQFVQIPRSLKGSSAKPPIIQSSCEKTAENTLIGFISPDSESRALFCEKELASINDAREWTRQVIGPGELAQDEISLIEASLSEFDSDVKGQGLRDHGASDKTLAQFVEPEGPKASQDLVTKEKTDKQREDNGHYEHTGQKEDWLLDSGKTPKRHDRRLSIEENLKCARHELSISNVECDETENQQIEKTYKIRIEKVHNRDSSRGVEKSKSKESILSRHIPCQQLQDRGLVKNCFGCLQRASDSENSSNAISEPAIITNNVFQNYKGSSKSNMSPRLSGEQTLLKSQSDHDESHYNVNFHEDQKLTCQSTNTIIDKHLEYPPFQKGQKTHKMSEIDKGIENEQKRIQPSSIANKQLEKSCHLQDVPANACDTKEKDQLMKSSDVRDTSGPETSDVRKVSEWNDLSNQPASHKETADLAKVARTTKLILGLKTHHTDSCSTKTYQDIMESELQLQRPLAVESKPSPELEEGEILEESLMSPDGCENVNLPNQMDKFSDREKPTTQKSCQLELIDDTLDLRKKLERRKTFQAAEDSRPDPEKSRKQKQKPTGQKSALWHNHSPLDQLYKKETEHSYKCDKIDPIFSDGEKKRARSPSPCEHGGVKRSRAERDDQARTSKSARDVRRRRDGEPWDWRRLSSDTQVHRYSERMRLKEDERRHELRDSSTSSRRRNPGRSMRDRSRSGSYERERSSQRHRLSPTRPDGQEVKNKRKNKKASSLICRSESERRSRSGSKDSHHTQVARKLDKHTERAQPQEHFPRSSYSEKMHGRSNSNRQHSHSEMKVKSVDKDCDSKNLSLNEVPDSFQQIRHGRVSSVKSPACENDIDQEQAGLSRNSEGSE